MSVLTVAAEIKDAVLVLQELKAMADELKADLGIPADESLLDVIKSIRASLTTSATATPTV